MDKHLKSFTKYIVCITVAVLIVTRFDKIISWADNLFNIAFPLIIGCFMAYIINIVMKALEKNWFPEETGRRMARMKRPICLFASIFIIVGALILIVWIVLPELINASSVIGKEIPIYFEKIQKWILKNEELFPYIGDEIAKMEVNWRDLFNKLITYATSGITSMLNSAVSILMQIVGSVVNMAIALIFAIYILLNKEKLQHQARTLEEAYVKPSISKWINKVLDAAHECFTSFITGQCVEAVILGILCTVGMLILRFPYAPMVGTFVGATALIPMVGAYLGAFVGAFIIFTDSPVKALAFIVFIIILQQLEGNIIYPKVVGSSIGLPGMWVLAAVTIGGGLAGIPGMLIGVPMAATIYRLISQDARDRLEAKKEIQESEEKE